MPNTDMKAVKLQNNGGCSRQRPHKSALATDAINQLHTELAAKMAARQGKFVDWHDIQHNPPPELKILPIFIIPHKSLQYRTSWTFFPPSSKMGCGSHQSTKVPSNLHQKVQLTRLNTCYHEQFMPWQQPVMMSIVVTAKWDIKDGF